MDTDKRLFFGAEIAAPWPQLPAGRMIQESQRHFTLAFLGTTSYSKLEQLLPHFPKPSFAVGPVGWSDRILFIPEENPRVVAYHVSWLHGTLEPLHHAMKEWLGLEDARPFLPHVTVARSPFDQREWSEHFQEIPLFVRAIHLYESTGNLNYAPRWTYPLLPPFEELEHTADIAFLIRGENLEALCAHAQLALSFTFPPFVRFFSKAIPPSLDALISLLNQGIGRADQEIGCPFKAVSFHGDLVKKDNLLHWEMIVDV